MNLFTPSCDTLAIPKSATLSGDPILAKNSDRDPGEAQLLLCFPAADHAPGERCKCTYIEVEQAAHTYAVIGSKPWWMWGFEMGVNEMGVSIGNEAEWSPIDPISETALLGMDLVRLGLERGATAWEALHVMIDLLEENGQGGACKYGASIEDSAYHNTFLIADPNEMYLLETVDRQWVYKKIDDILGISNVYTIQEAYDGRSDDLVSFAVENGLHTEGMPFNFAKSFTLFYTGCLSGHIRSNWSTETLKANRGHIDPANVMEVLRGHYEGSFVQNRWSPAACYVPSVCMHGSGAGGGSQTAASMVIEYHRETHRELAYTYWASMCPPCCTIVAPFYNTGYIPEALAVGGDHYTPDSFWWKAMRLTIDIEGNYEKYHALLAEKRERLESAFYAEAKSKEAEARRLLDAGEKEEAKRLLNAFTDTCVTKIGQVYDALIEKIESEMLENPTQAYRRQYLNAYRKRAGLPGHITRT